MLDPKIDAAALLARYDVYRSKSRALSNVLFKRVPKPWIFDAARRVGMYEDGALVFGSESEVGVFMDFLLLGCVRGQRTMVETALTPRWPLLGTDERLILGAMVDARYSIYEVREAHAGLGVLLHDEIVGDDLFVVDRNYGTSAKKGQLLAGRMLMLPELWMSSGASLPVPPEHFTSAVRAAQIARDHGDAVRANRLPRGLELDFGEMVTRILLDEGMGDLTEFVDSGKVGAEAARRAE